MSKNSRGIKERTREQELKHQVSLLAKEVEKKERELRTATREITSLRRQLAKVDLSRYTDMKEILEDHAKNEESKEATVVLSQLESNWKCYDCKEGVLRGVPYPKAGETWYYRKCDCCSKRTKSQKYHPNVKGIFSVKPE